MKIIIFTLSIIFSLTPGLNVFAQEVISEFNNDTISVLNEELREIKEEATSSVLPTNSTTATSSAPTTDAGVANKKYVDDQIAAITFASLVSSKVYDSGWFAVTANTAYSKTHSLGTTKVLVLVYVSDSSDGSGKVGVGYSTLGTDGGVFLTSLSTTAISIRTNVNYVYFGLNSDGSNWQLSSGYGRIVILALA